MSSINSFDAKNQDYCGTPPHGSSRTYSTASSPPANLSDPLIMGDPGSKRTRNQKQNSGTPQTPPAKRESKFNNEKQPDMAVLVTRTNLYDAENGSDEDTFPIEQPSTFGNNHLPQVAEYSYNPNDFVTNTDRTIIAVCRVPPSPSVTQPFWMELNVVDKSVQNPFDRSVQKYWHQRRRLFSRFDCGIQLDEEGWFSVTPEQIADHVATRTVDLYRQIYTSSASGLIVLDAFCGCGGNSIAFAKQQEVSIVVCVDIDRAKLIRAANNAAIYEIPVNKIVFIECNVLFLLEHCYKNGDFILDQPIDTPERAEAMMAAIPPPVPSEKTNHGYLVGGIDILPAKIGVIFMDPPWGGVDYKVFGKDGYCLERNMRISRPSNQVSTTPHASEGMSDGFFDTFCASQPRNKQERKAAFNVGFSEDNSVNGCDLLRLAASAAAHAMVVFDVPRNTNRTSLGRAALHAGYRGNCKLVEHCLNNRLKTITAYFGIDWREEMLPKTSM
jgi:trimethylguanosine synthase